MDTTQNKHRGVLAKMSIDSSSTPRRRSGSGHRTRPGSTANAEARRPDSRTHVQDSRPLFSREIRTHQPTETSCGRRSSPSSNSDWSPTARNATPSAWSRTPRIWSTFAATWIPSLRRRRTSKTTGSHPSTRFISSNPTPTLSSPATARTGGSLCGSPRTS